MVFIFHGQKDRGGGGIEVMHAIGREANLGGSILPLNKSLGIWA